MRWSVTTPATGSVLTWDQINAHVRPGSVSEQPYLLDLLASSTAYAETMMQCCLLPQTLTAVYDIKDIGWHEVQDLYCAPMRQGWALPRGPVIAINSVLDITGTPVNYMLHSEGNADYIVPLQPISAYQCPITVVFQAGFASIPSDILTAIRVHLATVYAYREDVSNMPANAIHRLEEFYRFRGRGTVVA